METYGGGIPTTTELIDTLVRTLTSGWGIVAVLGFLLLMIAAAASKRARWVAFAGVVYMGTFGFSWTPWFHHVLVQPLEILKLQSRNLSVVLLFVVCFGACFSARGTRQKLLIGATTAVFVFQLVYCSRLMFGGWFMKGAFGAILYFMIFVAFAIGLSLMLQDLKDVHSAIRCVAIAALLFCLGTAAQLVIDRGSILAGGRLASTPGTATHTAECIAVMLPAIVFLIFSKSEPRVLRALWLATAGALVIFLALTGTRNGVVMAFFAMVLLFRGRLGKMVIACILVGIAATVVWQFFGGTEASETASRLVSFSDTRSAAWRVSLAGFLANPAFGSLSSHQLIVENSYLTVASDMGFYGLIPLGIAMGLVCWALIKLNRVRPLLGEDTMLADFVTAGFVSLAIGAIFEGYLVGMLHIEVYATYIYLAILGFILDRMRQVMQGAATGEAYDQTYQAAEPEPAYDMAGAGYN